MKKLFAIFAMGSVALFTGCNDLDPVSSQTAVSEKTTTATALTGKVSKSGRRAAIPVTSSSSFAVLAGTTITNDGASLITGDIGVSPGTALTGFQPIPLNTISGPGTVTSGLGIVQGIIYAGGPVAQQAHNDAVILYNYLVAQVADTTYSGVTQLNGMIFTPGVYNFAPSANLQVNGTMYLDFQGNSDAQFIFQMGSTLVTMAGSNVIALNNNNQTCPGANVYWAIGSSATINGAQFIGSVIATTTITMTSGSNVSGRLWALNGAVTMITDTISACGGTTIPPTPKPCNDFVTGGGWIKIGSKEKATFGVSGGIKNSKLWGNLLFIDHSKNGIKVKSTGVTAYTTIDAYTRQIEGTAKINGQGNFTYKVIVVDNGEPGRSDRFSIQLSNGYSATGTLDGGNIQLHNKCDASDNEDNHHEGCEDSDDDHNNGSHDARDDHHNGNHNSKDDNHKGSNHGKDDRH